MFDLDGLDFSWIKSKLLPILGGIVLLVLLIPLLLPSGVYKNLIDRKLESQTGLEFNFVGDYSFSLIPSISFQAENVDFNGTLAKGVDVVGSIESLSFDMNLLDILVGTFVINDIQLISPTLTIDGDFTNQLPQWIHQTLKGARKSDIRYLEIAVSVLENTHVNFAEIIDGSITWNKSPDNTLSVQKLRLYGEKPENGGDLMIDGDAFLNDRAVDLNLRLESPDQFLQGYRSELTFTLDTSPMKVAFNGSAAHRYAFVAQGELSVEVPSLYEYCRWLNAPETCQESRETFELKSTMNLRDQRMQIEKADISLNNKIINAQGTVEFIHAKPEVNAKVSVPQQKFSDFKDHLIELTHLNFEDLLLESFDANVDIMFEQINMSNGDVLRPKINILLNDGRLAISSERLDFLGSLTNVRLRWHKGIDTGYMDLRFNTSALDIAKIQNVFNLNYQMTGALKSSFEIQSLGSEISTMMETARIYGEFSLLDGSFQNPQVIEALSGQQNESLPFAQIKGRFKGDRGQVISQDIEMDVAHVDVEGAASYDFINDVLKIQLNSDIPNPNNPVETIEGYVDVSGKIGALNIRTSLGGELSETPQQNGLHSGLIPNEEPKRVDENISDDQEFILDERDLLD